MAKMSNAQLLSFARNEIDRSKNWRSSSSGYGYDEGWRRYIDLYSGLHYDTRSGTDQLIVNIVFAIVNVMAPAVAINNPRFVVNARRPEEAPRAIIAEEVLNYLWRRNDYQRDFRLAVLDWILTGHGWLKVGYKSTKKPERKTAEGLDDGGAHQNAGVGSSEGGAEGIDDREDVEGNVESELNLGEDDNAPFVERISIFDMYVDPDARHPKEMRWIAQRTWRAVPDVQVDSRYSATQRVRVSGSQYSMWDSEDGDARSSGTGNNMTADAPNPGAIAYAEIIEFYDLRRGTVGTFAADASPEGDVAAEVAWLIKPTKIPYGTGHPFVMLRNYEVPDHFYPIGDVQQVESLQLELNETRTQMLNYRKKFRRAWVYKKDAFDRDGVRALESDQDNVMIPVQGDEDPSGVLAPVPAAITPPEFFEQSAMIQTDMEQVSGVSDYAKGAPQQSIKRTATEAAMIADAANSRSQDRLAKIEFVLADAGGRVIQLMQQYMTGDQVARIVTIPINGWLNYDKDYIQGDFDFEVRGGSTEPRNETFRRQSALQLADISMPFLEMGVADPVALWTKLLRDGFGEKDPQRYVKAPEPPPPEEGGPPPPEGGMPPEQAPPPDAMMGQGPPGVPLPPGMPPGGPVNGIPPEMAGMPAGPPPPGGGVEMMPPMDPSLGPPPQELTPELLSALLAMNKGMGPNQGPPPERMAVAPR